MIATLDGTLMDVLIVLITILVGGAGAKTVFWVIKVLNIVKFLCNQIENNKAVKDLVKINLPASLKPTIDKILNKIGLLGQGKKKTAFLCDEFSEAVYEFTRYKGYDRLIAFCGVDAFIELARQKDYLQESDIESERLYSEFKSYPLRFTTRDGVRVDALTMLGDEGIDKMVIFERNNIDTITVSSIEDGANVTKITFKDPDDVLEWTIKGDEDDDKVQEDSIGS